MAGYSDVVEGAQWGDEGKGKLIDMRLDTGNYSIVGRYGGGPNAGHTLSVNGHIIATHGLPSGVFHPKIHLYIGAGCVINPEKLVAEIKEVESLGVSLEERLHISPFATLIQPHHLLTDSMYGGHLGTTGNGIGPAYSQRMMRSLGPNLEDLRFAHAIISPHQARDIVKSNLGHCVSECLNPIKNHPNAHQMQKIFDLFNNDPTQKYLSSLARLGKYLERDPLFLTKQIESGKNVLFEGAQGFMIDVVYGNTPFTTSSSTIAAGAYTGGDLSNKYHRKTMAVVKAIPSRVGAGPFVGELGGKKSEEYCAAKDSEGNTKHTKEFEHTTHNPQDLLQSSDQFELGIALRMLGGEYGATTKRPRRVGILDLPQLEYAAKLTGADELFITKMDQVELFNNTLFHGPVMVDTYQINGSKLNTYPITTNELASVTPHSYLNFAATSLPTNATKWSDIPHSLVEFLTAIEDRTGCKVSGIGVGPEREKVIMRG